MSEEEATPVDPREGERKPGLAVVYANLYPVLLTEARRHGYALAQGCLARVFDVVAIPWTEDAANEETLVRALVGKLGWALDTERRHHAAAGDNGGRVICHPNPTRRKRGA